MSAGVLIAVVSSRTNHADPAPVGSASMILANALQWKASCQFEHRQAHPFWIAAAQEQTKIGDDKITLLGPGEGLRMFNADLNGTFEGKPIPQRVFVTSVMVNRDGRWLETILPNHGAQALAEPFRVRLASVLSKADAIESAAKSIPRGAMTQGNAVLIPFPLVRRLYRGALLAAALASVTCWTGSALASQKVCRSLDQRYEQIEKATTPIELNAMLFSAADKGCAELAVRLMDAGASLQARDRLGFSPLSRAATAGQAELVTLFLDRGAAINARGIDGSTPLYQAAEAGRLPIVRQLVEHGADVRLAGRTGITPLAAGAYMGSEPIVELLIEKGADPNAVDNTQKSAIIYAAGKGFADVARLLLDHGVDVNARYGNELTALMWAAGYTVEAGVDDVAKVITLLLDRGAHIDDQDNRGRTALMIAAELNHETAVDLLLSRGADKSLRDKEGKAAGDLTSLTALREKLAAQ